MVDLSIVLWIYPWVQFTCDLLGFANIAKWKMDERGPFTSMILMMVYDLCLPMKNGDFPVRYVTNDRKEQ